MHLLQEEQNRLRLPQPKLENINETNTNLRLVIVSSDWAIRNLTPKSFVKSLTEDLPVLVQVITVANIEPC